MLQNLPVKTLVHKSLTLEGYSRAVVQTYWRIPELKLGFDLGGQPWSFMGTPNWFVSHTSELNSHTNKDKDIKTNLHWEISDWERKTIEKY